MEVNSQPSLTTTPCLTGEERWADHIPWSRATCLLSSAQLEEAQGTASYTQQCVRPCDTTIGTQIQVGVREYVKCLEKSVIGCLGRFGVEGFTTENTGVWVQHPLKGESKIGSIGKTNHQRIACVISVICRYPSESWCVLPWFSSELQHRPVLVQAHHTLWSGE